jgi:hypothetical protein
MRLRALWHDEAGVAALAALESLRRPERQRQDVKTLHLLLASLDAVTATFQERGRSEPATVNPLWPTQDRVMSFYRARSGERNASRAVFETQWATMPDYLSDLFRWALHPAQYAAHQAMAAGAAGALLTAGDLTGATTEIAQTELEDLLSRPIFRMKLLICTSQPVTPMFRAALALHYRAATDWWSGAYAALLQAAGLRLRPDVPMESFAALMTAMEEGLALRFAADPATTRPVGLVKSSLQVGRWARPRLVVEMLQW